MATTVLLGQSIIGGDYVTPADAIPTHISVPADGQLVVDGQDLDARGIPIDQTITMPLVADAEQGEITITRATSDVWNATCIVNIAEGDTPPWTEGETTYEAFPAYIVWPADEAQAPQTATLYEDAARKAQVLADLRADIANTANHYDADRTYEWARESALKMDFVATTLDASDPEQAEIHMRYNNTVLWAKSMVGAAWWACKQWDDNVGWVALADSDATGWEDLADQLAEKAKTCIGWDNSAKYFFWKHDPEVWGPYFSRGEPDAPTVPGVYECGNDYVGNRILQPATMAEWDSIITTHYVAAQKASVGL